jgi:L-alanine-DL-glutamate epimerase-like enolase superfamily enzyme
MKARGRGHGRRAFLGQVIAVPLASWAARGDAFAAIGQAAGQAVAGKAPAVRRVSAGKATDVRIEEMTASYEEHRYRTPLKFGGTLTDRVTILNVRCVVSSRSGKRAHGFGSTPMGNVWAWPSKTLSYDQTLASLQALAARIRDLAAAHREYGHPVDLAWALDAPFLDAAREVERARGLSEPIPKMATLVIASPFDAAIHDAFGKLHGVSSYQTYGPEFMTHDLSHYLGKGYEGEWIAQYVTAEPKPRMPLYHLVGAVDPIEDGDITTRLNDGLPETLPEWIRADGLTNIKIKLNGSDLAWDVARVVRVDRVTTDTQRTRGVTQWVYSLDFNERCPNVDYLLEFLAKLREQTPDGYARIQYVEQPTARDLRADRANVMHKAAALKPVVIDESLTDYETLMLARDMGYSGAALKACKGQTHALILGAAIQHHKLFLCVQDLTCPGASLVHSAGLAAHVKTVAAIESNSRQYVPVANKGWEKKYPGLFEITDGTVKTGELTGPGLSLPDGPLA